MQSISIDPKHYENFFWYFFWVHATLKRACFELFRSYQEMAQTFKHCFRSLRFFWKCSKPYCLSLGSLKLNCVFTPTSKFHTNFNIVVPVDLSLTSYLLKQVTSTTGVVLLKFYPTIYQNLFHDVPDYTNDQKTV